MTKKGTKEATPKNYAELEQEVQKSLERLQKEDLPLDEATKVYEDGMRKLEEMQKLLDELREKVSDSIDGKAEEQE